MAKMLYEHHFAEDDVHDPDDAAVGFEELSGAARARTAQAELAAPKSANGGFKLAYKLMTTSLHLHAKVLYVVTRPLWEWYAQQVK